MNVELLKSVKKVITHANADSLCPDGVASALIILDARPGLEVQFVKYGAEQKTLKPEPGVLFCDMTPYVERDKSGQMTETGRAQAKAWVDAGAIVLDHHEGTKDLVDLFGVRGAFGALPGVSGAVLAYSEVWLPFAEYSHLKSTLVHSFAKYVSVRDTWQRDSPFWSVSCQWAAALSFWPWATLWRDGLERVLLDRYAVGEALLQRQAEADQRTLAEAQRFEVKGLRVACFEGGSRESSDVAELLGDQVDFVVAWHYFTQDGEAKVKLSLRSRSTFDVLPLARWLGGNGHAKAAGAVVPVDRRCGFALGTENPYDFIAQRVSDFLER